MEPSERTNLPLTLAAPADGHVPANALVTSSGGGSVRSRARTGGSGGTASADRAGGAGFGLRGSRTPPLPPGGSVNGG